MYLLSAIYLTGYLVAFIMQRTEISAEKSPYTFGDRLLISATSLLSWLMVIIVLVAAWVKSLKDFWTIPIDNEVIEVDRKSLRSAPEKTQQN